jgi:hypothetical protein
VVDCFRIQPFIGPHNRLPLCTQVFLTPSFTERKKTEDILPTNQAHSAVSNFAEVCGRAKSRNLSGGSQKIARRVAETAD